MPIDYGSYDPGSSPPPTPQPVLPGEPPYSSSGQGWAPVLSDFLRQFINELSGSFGGGGGSAPFNYKPYALKDLNLQIEELKRQRTTGVRDVGLARRQALKDVNANALDRGIFNSGLRTRTRKQVKRKAGRAENDLRDRIRISLERLRNQKAEINARPLSSGASSGYNPAAFASAISNLIGSYGTNVGSFFTGYEPPATTQPATSSPGSSVSGGQSRMRGHDPYA